MRFATYISPLRGLIYRFILPNGGMLFLPMKRIYQAGFSWAPCQYFAKVGMAEKIPEIPTMDILA
jgi:hypothetical protein